MIDRYWAIAFFAAFLTSGGQLLLKLGARAHELRASIRLWLNPLTITGYLVLLIVTLMNLYAFKVVPLRAAILLGPLTIILVALGSRLFLGERPGGVRWLGFAIICLGIALFNV